MIGTQNQCTVVADGIAFVDGVKFFQRRGRVVAEAAAVIQYQGGATPGRVPVFLGIELEQVGSVFTAGITMGGDIATGGRVMPVEAEFHLFCTQQALNFMPVVIAAEFANKFLPDTWGVSLPLSVQYQGSIFRPFTKPTSDEQLIDHDIQDIMDDYLNEEITSPDPDADKLAGRSRYYQSRTIKETFKTSYKKEKRSKNFVIQSMFERPAFQFEYSLAKSTKPLQDDTTKSYKSKLFG